ncbi:MAG: BLUF domain-containing protein [Pseudomonadota bacterium]
MIYRLVYISRCAVSPVPDAVAGIARTSLSYNARVGITGFLYFDEDAFIQEIEGVREDVEALYSKIAADARHSDVRVLLSQDAQTRVFGEWSMAFYDGQASNNLIRERFGADFLDSMSERDGSEILRTLRELSLSNDPSAADLGALSMDNA